MTLGRREPSCEPLFHRQAGLTCSRGSSSFLFAPLFGQPSPVWIQCGSVPHEQIPISPPAGVWKLLNIMIQYVLSLITDGLLILHRPCILDDTVHSYRGDHPPDVVRSKSTTSMGGNTTVAVSAGMLKSHSVPSQRCSDRGGDASR